MKLLRPVLIGLGAVATLLVVPPAFAWARQMVLVQTAYEGVGAYAATGELWSAFETWEAYHRNPKTLSHPYTYPYLECDVDSQASVSDKEWKDYSEKSIWSAKIAPEELMRTFIVEHDWRLKLAYQEVLRKQFSTPYSALLTACIQTSILASACAEKVRHAAYGSDKIDEFLVGRHSDRTHAQTYCASLKGIIRMQQ